MSEQTDTDTALPRACRTVFGHEQPVSAFEQALSGNRVHHGWLLCGPKGIGKCSFAYRAAQALIAGANTIGVTDEDLFNRIADGNEPNIRIIERVPNEKTGKLATRIAVEQIRDLRRDLTLAADKGAWRCIIVDAAEDMNAASANALLKILEEPPENVAFFLVSHAPGRLLPTIRSRCRRLDFAPLDTEAMASAFHTATGQEMDPRFAEMAAGSVTTALRLQSAEGGQLAEGLERILSPLPDRINRAKLHELADKTLGNANPDGFRIASDLLIHTISDLSLSAVEAAQKPQALANIPCEGAQSAAHWAELAAELRETSDKAIALNLDPRQSLLDMIGSIETTARGIVR